MIDNLTQWLRDEASFAYHRAEEDMLTEAADRIETLEAENKRLRGALRVMIYETTHLSPMEPDGSHWCRITADALNIARAALEPKL